MDQPWNIRESENFYQIRGWGSNYFQVNEKGNVSVFPSRAGKSVDLMEIIRSLNIRGIDAPVLLRFDGIIKDRVKRIQRAFYSAFDAFSYRAKYHLAYPIKVNQQFHVIDTVRKAGDEVPLALEVGSKPELLAVLAIHDTPNGILLCNGYKDREYIELAVLASKLGRRPIVIIEQYYELDMVLDISEKLGAQVDIGIRMRPTVKVAGHWADSAGERAKFGLTTDRVLKVIDRLNASGKGHWLKLLHYHVGSQITSISSIKQVLREATRMYVEIAKLAPSMEFFDCGGGLAVDYDGSKSSDPTSMNYTEEEYARDVVYSIKSACDTEGIAYPDIISESGRATVAHHAMLVIEVTDVAKAVLPVPTIDAPPTDHRLLADLQEMYNSLNEQNLREIIHDAVDLRREVLEQFVRGDLSISERSYAENVLKHLNSKLYDIGIKLDPYPEEIDDFERELRDVYFCNFSVFQSIPDSWAIGQLFPIMPLHRLNEQPTQRAVIADLTCDSDGKVDCFISTDSKSSTQFHTFKEDEPYYLGVFLVGAYQEILGDLHNLFGDTNAVHVSIGDDDAPVFTHVVNGDSNREVLEYVEFEPSELYERMRISVEQALKTGTLVEEHARFLLQRYREAMEGYTYLVK